MNSTTHLKKIALTEKIHRELQAAEGERSKRRAHVRTVLGDEPGWAVYERELVRKLVNAELTSRGMAPVDDNAIISAEVAASGAENFTLRFSQNAADLVLAKVDA